MNSSQLSTLASSELTSSLVELRARQRIDDVQFLRLLGEFDDRKAFLALGFDSTWSYCQEVLRLSNGTAGRRIHSARLLRRFPAVADFLSDGRLSLGGLAKLRDVLDDENHRRILQQVSMKTEDQIEAIVRTYRPIAFVRDTVVRTVKTVAVIPQVSDSISRGEAVPVAPPVQMPVAGSVDRPVTVALNLPPSTVRPLDAEYVSVTLKVPKEFMDDLNQVTAALSHVVRSRKPADVLRECIRRTLEAVEKRRGGLPARTRMDGSSSGSPEASAAVDENASRDRSATEAPITPSLGVNEAPTQPMRHEQAEVTPRLGVNQEIANRIGDEVAAVTPRLGVADSTGVRLSDGTTRAVPIDVARRVWRRDGGSCSFVGTNGRRCGSTDQLELHHREAFALGGATTFDNLTVTCRHHNRFEAQRDFGDELMSRFARRH